MQNLLAVVEVFDKLRDAAGVAKLGALGFARLRIGRALVGQRDFQSLVEEGELAQALRQRVVVVFRDGEDGLVGQEVNFGAAPLGVAGLRSSWSAGRSDNPVRRCASRQISTFEFLAETH